MFTATPISALHLMKCTWYVNKLNINKTVKQPFSHETQLGSDLTRSYQPVPAPSKNMFAD